MVFDAEDKYLFCSFFKQQSKHHLKSVYLTVSVFSCHVAATVFTWISYGLFLFYSKVKHSLLPWLFNSQLLLRIVLCRLRYEGVDPTCVPAPRFTNHQKTLHSPGVWWRLTVTGCDGSGRQEHGGRGGGPATSCRWQRWGCHKLRPPGRPHVSCESPREVSVVDSEGDSWCSLRLASGSPSLEEWAPSAHLGLLPRNKKRWRGKQVSNDRLATPLTGQIAQLQGEVS